MSISSQFAHSISLYTLLILSSVSIGLQAQGNEENKCRGILDGEKRLACYDAIYGRASDTNGVNTTSTNRSSDYLSSEMNAIDKRASTSINNDNQSNKTFAADSPSLPSNSQDTSYKQSLDQENFGAESIDSENSNTEIEEMRASLLNIKIGLRDYATFTLDNGQVWKQTQLSQLRLKNGQTVIIKKGILGAYYLSPTTSNRQFRVKRVK